MILSIIGNISASGADYCSVEFQGNVDQFSIEERFTIANMGVEMGVKNAVFPVDDVTINYLKSIKILKSKYTPIIPDKNATYDRELTYNLTVFEPVIAVPHSVDKVKPIKEVEGIEIQQCLLGTCTNGRLSDFQIAAKILKGKTVHPNVRLLILPASRKIYLDALNKGLIKTFLEAGGTVLPPGCGPYRNFKGRMGCNEAEIYLASPATVAKSAIYGKITDPRKEARK